MTHNQFGTQEVPAGFALPKAAVKLLNTAALARWSTGWQWSADNSDNPFVTIHVADPETREYFKYTWHSRGTGALRLFSKIRQAQAGAPWVDAPSVKAAEFRVREVAAKNS
ncbi:hypothetical protein [Streptomyces fulvorobeus]|nr:hypothetical protein [Streptomyces fulvorobeus]NYE44260.1 hypothetical protein [Streptomyces fulvorobeus]